MPILNIETGLAGTTGVFPSIAYIQTSDTETKVLASGYLNQAVQSGLASFSLPCIACVSTIASAGAQPSVGWYQVSYTASGNPVTATWSLIPTTEPGSIVLPTIANHAAVFLDANGTLGEDVATMINGGNIQAGLSGTAGYLASFPATVLKGSLEVKAVANTGNTITTISNAAMGQASVISIPDPAGATADFVLAPAALVNGNIPQASGTAGLIADSGISATSVSSAITQLGQLQQISVTLNTAAVIAAYATPQVLIPAVAGKVAIVHSATVYTASTGNTAFATGVAPIIQYGTTVHGAGTIATGTGLVTGDIEAATSQVRTIGPAASAVYTGITNTAVTFSCTTAYTAGTGTSITFTLVYELISATV